MRQAKQIARELNVAPNDVLEMGQRLSGGDIAIEANSDSAEEPFAPIAYLAAPNADPAQVVEAEQSAALQSQGLLRALHQLDERSREIVIVRWLREEDKGGAATLHELAGRFGISAERVRQIEAAALDKLEIALS